MSRNLRGTCESPPTTIRETNIRTDKFFGHHSTTRTSAKASINFLLFEVSQGEVEPRFQLDLNMRINTVPIAAAALVVGLQGAAAFAPRSPTTQRKATSQHASVVPQGTEGLQNNIDANFSLSPHQVHPIVTLGTEPKTKVINAFGMWCMGVSLVICPIWWAAMKLCAFSYKFDDSWDPNREFYDGLGKVWAKSWLTVTGSFPTFSGELKLLEKGPHNKPCLFVANHASWLDIPVLCSCTDQVFKFIAKGELGTLPCIGDQLTGGQHILIDRDDKRSQLRSFKQSLKCIKNGVPIVAFPEGKRSDDGRLMDFKGGLFAIAVKTGVPIVPISLSHTHAIMPGTALVPVQPGGGKLHVHVHPAIEVEGKTDADLEKLVRTALLETLPKYQHPAKAVVQEETRQLIEA